MIVLEVLSALKDLANLAPANLVLTQTRPMLILAKRVLLAVIVPLTQEQHKLCSYHATLASCVQEALRHLGQHQIALMEGLVPKDTFALQVPGKRKSASSVLLMTKLGKVNAKIVQLERNA